MRELKKELWPNKVRLNKVEGSTGEMRDIETWLGENMGPFKGEWNVVWDYSHTDFYFRNGKNATLFALRWS